MSALKDAASRAERLAARFPRMPDRLLAVEHASRRLAMLVQGRLERVSDDEPLDQFLDRMEALGTGLNRAHPRDVRRLVDVVWSVSEQDGLARAALDTAVTADRKSYDRAVVLAYLRHFPTYHTAFASLAAAARLVAERRDWPWQDRGTRWQLWNADDGPRAVAREMMLSPEPRATLREMGFEGDLAEGRFVSAALTVACREAAIKRGAEAEQAAQSLIALFANLEGAQGLNAHFARAVLKPWVQNSPSDELRRAITSTLIRRIGDPRIETAKWQFIADQLSAEFPGEDLFATIAVLRRWLVQATVRQFFEVIGRTTTNPEQWAQREAFWLAYLDAGVISDAWFAFGQRAELDARRLVKDLEEGAGYGRIQGGGDAGHSALLMTMGDLFVAEWSHNGMCRFWGPGAKGRPKLNQHTYSGYALRRTEPGKDFEAMSHYSGWQSRFAYHVYKMTGIRHPRWR